MPKLTAFIARSFDKSDDVKIQPIIDFLASFKKLGLDYVTAEPAEPELVHKKVRRQIDESQLFIGVITRRFPICPSPDVCDESSDSLGSRPAPSRWCPPLWILQESGYALAKAKRMIMFREADVEFPALQGDLEYIPYDPSNPTSAVTKANEMVVSIIAESAGTVVETVVREAPASKVEEMTPAQPQSAEKMEEEPSLGKLFHELAAAVGEREWTRGEQALDAALALLKKQGKEESGVLWRGFYLKGRCLAGEGQAFYELKDLIGENSDEPILWAHLGACYLEYRDYARAAESYKHAATLRKVPESVDFTVRAARSLRIGKRHDESEQLLLPLIRQGDLDSFADKKFKVLRELYETVRESGDTIRASAIGELALQENPGQKDLRFSLAFSYGEGGIPELAVYHYKLATGSDTQGTFNNLGAEYSNCELPILSVDCYRKAIEMGNTLAASNLARTYLNAGAAEAAEEVLRDALEKDDCDPQVPRTLALVAERRDDEKQREEAKLERAESDHNFLVALGAGFLTPETGTFGEGIWKFPFGEIELASSEGALLGETTTEDSEAVGALAKILAGRPLPGAAQKQTRKFLLIGHMTGRVCHYYLTKELTAGPSSTSAPHETSTTEGYIVFHSDNTSAEAAELKDGKLQKPYHITRA